MDNQEKEKIDLSQFSFKKKEPVCRPKVFDLGESWRKMGKRNRIFSAIIAISLVLAIVILISFFNKREIGPASNAGPVEYAPPSEYPLMPGEKYTPAFP
jgi:hypothetical protein